MVSYIVYDGFYENPYDIREMALKEEFSVVRNLPGKRTKSFLDDKIKNKISEIIRPFAGEVTDWLDGTDTGQFISTTSSDQCWFHTDQYTNWAGVLFLTPNPPINTGTGLFRHKSSGLYRAPKDEFGRSVGFDHQLVKHLENDYMDKTKWEMIDMIGNVFNRLVLYRGDIFHNSLEYFGDSPENGRLFQTFFFCTQK